MPAILNFFWGLLCLQVCAKREIGEGHTRGTSLGEDGHPKNKDKGDKLTRIAIVSNANAEPKEGVPARMQAVVPRGEDGQALHRSHRKDS